MALSVAHEIRDNARHFFVIGTSVGTGDRVKLSVGKRAHLISVESTAAGTATAHTPVIYSAESGGRVVWAKDWGSETPGLTFNLDGGFGNGVYMRTDSNGDVWLQPSPNATADTYSAEFVFEVW